MLNALIITIVLLLIANCKLEFKVKGRANNTPHRPNGEFKRQVLIKDGDTKIGKFYL